MLGLHMCRYFFSAHVHENGVRAGPSTNAAETVKRTKYRSLTDRYPFEAVTIETADTSLIAKRQRKYSAILVVG